MVYDLGRGRGGLPRGPLPQPITIQLTIVEASQTHVMLDALLKVSEKTDMPEGFNADVTRRVVKALERKLKQAGCTLDDLGWKV